MKPFSKIAVIFAREVMMAIIFGALKDIFFFFFGSDVNELWRNGGWGLFSLPTRSFDMRILKWMEGLL